MPGPSFPPFYFPILFLGLYIFGGRVTTIVQNYLLTSKSSYTDCCCVCKHNTVPLGGIGGCAPGTAEPRTAI